jgi:hypothetical protein
MGKRKTAPGAVAARAAPCAALRAAAATEEKEKKPKASKADEEAADEGTELPQFTVITALSERCCRRRSVG